MHEPLPGNPAGIDGVARTVGGQAATLRGVAGRLTRLLATLDRGRSAAGSLAADRLTTAADDARAAGRLLDGTAGLLTQYSLRLAELQRADQEATAQYADARDRRVRWAREVQAARAAAAAGTAPEWEVSSAQRRLDDAEADVARASSTRTAVWEEHRAEIARAVARATALADARAVRAWALAAPGEVVGDLATSRQAGQEAAAAVTAVAAGGDGETARTLERLLRDGTDDPVFWSSFWDTVDAEQLYRAIDAMPDDVIGLERGFAGVVGPAAAGGVLGTLSAGLATWARSHSTSERRDLGNALGSRLPAAVASAPTVAVALLGVQPPRSPAEGGTSADDRARADVAHGILEGLEGPDALAGAQTYVHRDGWTSALASAALTAVSRDRAAALEFFAPADPDVLTARVDHWLGSTIFWDDDGEAVTAAFAAATMGGTEAASSWSEQARVAQLVSRATTVLPAGLLQLTDLSPAAEVSVARAYLPYFGQFSELADHTRADGWVEQTPGAETGTRPDVPLAYGLPAPPQPVQPWLDALSLREVVVGSSGTREGAAAWLADGEIYQDSIYAELFPADGTQEPGQASGLSDEDKLDAGVEAMADVAALAGILEFDGLRDAEIADARVEAAVDLGAAAIGSLSGPVGTVAAKKLFADAVTPAAQHAAANAVGSATDAAAAAGAASQGQGFMTATDVARHEIAATEDRVIEQATERLGEAAVTWSLARGETPAQAEARWSEIDPDNPEVSRALKLVYRNSADTRTGDPGHD
ncbi:hypothetical protein [Xylanimonas cellulosilytica]|nr:hypothetical protein [Xylanimonas cellulosilytica]